MVERKTYRVDLRSMAALCESNYLRLDRLLSVAFAESEDVRSANGHRWNKIACGSRGYVLLPDMDAALSLLICDAAPYTTTIRVQKCPLTHACSTEALDFFDGQTAGRELGDEARGDRELPFSGWSVSLALNLKVYHDLRMAEVTDYAGAGVGRSRHDYPNAAMLSVDERDQQNRMLSEWLRYALEKGVAPLRGQAMMGEGFSALSEGAIEQASNADSVSNR